jgi:GT2 family glycosyltransferase
MKIAIVCVNYNSYESLFCYLDSLDWAANLSKGVAEVQVYVADNSTKKKDVDKTKYKNLGIHIDGYNNLGYLGGAFEMINSMSSNERDGYDYIAISNVDITINKDFFLRLAELNHSDGLAWVAPSIFFERLNKVGSAEWDERPSAKKMKFYDVLYGYPALYYLYWLASRFKMRAGKNERRDERYIYSGYGSFMLFTKGFIAKQDKWFYESFLFGEEIFFAEMARTYNMKVLYAPQLRINDIGKVSTGKIASRNKLKMQKESNSYLYNTFFK